MINLREKYRLLIFGRAQTSHFPKTNIVPLITSSNTIKQRNFQSALIKF